jgi:hypothetical protein
MQIRLRLGYLCVTLFIVALGLVWRNPVLGLPWPIAKYGGSILWGAMVYFIVASFRPSSRRAVKVVAAVSIAVLVELIRLYHCPWLDEFRRRLAGRLLLGTHFSIWDILAYWIGIIAATVSEKLYDIHRLKLHSRQKPSSIETINS